MSHEILPGHWPTTGQFLEYMKTAYGSSLMVVVVFAVPCFRRLHVKEDDRLAGGIDPQWISVPLSRF